jgi:hypothetical protein
MLNPQAVTAPRRVVDLRGAALTPRGDAALALYRLRDAWESLDAADRAYLAPALRELVDGIAMPATAG